MGERLGEVSRRKIECFSYVVVYDTGYAPNPWGRLTLAVCKPAIRRTAQVGDWIVGLTSSKIGFKATYLMRVGEIITLEEYYQEERFGYKKPNFESQDITKWMGDNFYEERAGEIIQHPSAHNRKGRSGEELSKKMRVDLGGRNVLIADDYFYFGENAKELPRQLEFLKVRRAHRCNGIAGIRAIEKYAPFVFENPGVSGNPPGIKDDAKLLEHLHF